MPRVSVVIPTMNEEASIGRVIDEVRAALVGWDHEILIVDTDSLDHTRDIAAAKGDIVAALDADFTYPADRIPDFAQLIASRDADFVSGDRLSQIREGAMSGMHRVGNAILNLTFRRLFGFPIRDSQSGMWVFRRAILDGLEIHSDGMAFSEELKLEVIRRGWNFHEVAIAYRTRVGEKKIRSVRDAMKNELWLIRRRFGWTRAEA